MFSGGIPLTPADKSRLEVLSTEAGGLSSDLTALKDGMGPLYSEFSDEKGELSDLTAEKGDANNEYTKSHEGYTDAKADADRARADYRTDKSEAKQEEQRVRSKQDALVADNRRIRDKARALVTQEGELATLQRRAEFLRMTYVTEIENQYEMACLQAISENMNASGAILLSFHAASMKLNGAVSGSQTNVSAALNKPTYLNIAVERIKPTTHQQAENDVRGQQERVDDAKGQIAEMQADSYHRDDLAQAQKDAAKEVAERDRSKVDFDRKDAAAKGAKRGRDDSRVAFRDKEKAERRQQEVLRDYEQRIRVATRESEKKSEEIAANGRKRQDIVDKTYVKT
ncbi:MAG: hypothetical protein HN337_08130 [Deltaproteobacteria bacterium]|jgi:hypothetical protein|nr:hypothetical protein [Deltaproteobacteria bacterium]